MTSYPQDLPTGEHASRGVLVVDVLQLRVVVQEEGEPLVWVRVRGEGAGEGAG